MHVSVTMLKMITFKIASHKIFKLKKKVYEQFRMICKMHLNILFFVTVQVTKNPREQLIGGTHLFFYGNFGDGRWGHLSGPHHVSHGFNYHLRLDGILLQGLQPSSAPGGSLLRPEGSLLRRRQRRLVLVR